MGVMEARKWRNRFNGFEAAGGFQTGKPLKTVN
jgi:hypothetical protein